MCESLKWTSSDAFSDDRRTCCEDFWWLFLVEPGVIAHTTDRRRFHNNISNGCGVLRECVIGNKLASWINTCWREWKIIFSKSTYICSILRSVVLTQSMSNIVKSDTCAKVHTHDSHLSKVVVKCDLKCRIYINCSCEKYIELRDTILKLYKVRVYFM